MFRKVILLAAFLVVVLVQSGLSSELKDQSSSVIEPSKKQGILSRIDKCLTKPVLYWKVYRSSMVGTMVAGLGACLLYKSNYFEKSERSTFLEVNDALNTYKRQGMLSTEYAKELSNPNGF